MRKHLTAVLGVLAITMLAVACAQTDAGVTTKVKAKFAMDDTVKAYQIDVDTSNKVVTLSGTVDSAMAKDRAVEIARGTEGVSSVVDNLKVGEGSAALPGEYPTAPTTGRAEEAMKNAADRTGEAVREGADKVADTAREGASKVGEMTREGANKVEEAAREGKNKAEEIGHDVTKAVGDASITAAVKTKMLADTHVSGLKIDVDTTNGVVTLTGKVKSEAEKSAALRIARQTDGVKRVKDHLTIGS